VKPGGGRAKGHSWERAVANIFRAAGYQARRGLQSRDGSEAPDVIVDGLTWWIEAKCGGPARDPVAALEQAERASPGVAAVAICKRDRCEPTATVRLCNLAIEGRCGDLRVTMSLDDFVRYCTATEPPKGEP
jgi:hypothetical protein